MQDVTTSEIMDFLRENLVTKEEMQDLFATKQDVIEFKSDLLFEERLKNLERKLEVKPVY